MDLPSAPFAGDFPEQPFAPYRNLNFGGKHRQGNRMATAKDPTLCFAPLEVVERLLEIREELGYRPAIFLERVNDLAEVLDAFGFDIYDLSGKRGKLNYGDYTSPVVPGGDSIHTSILAH
jgi:hypothetical protein